MKWCNLFMMWCDGEDYELCGGDCLHCDEMEEGDETEEVAGEQE